MGYEARPVITFDETPPEPEDVELPDQQQVQQRSRAAENYTVRGIRYQRCGGGYRVIRKQKGSN